MFYSLKELEAIIDDALHTAMRAVRCASHSSLDNISPGALAFHRDMNLDIPLMADVLTLQQLRQKQIDQRLLRVNVQRRKHDFKVNDQVLVKRMLNHSAQMEQTYYGPYPITQIHTNGTVTVRSGVNQQVRYNIRRWESGNRHD